jgi:uncharacterized membrane protein
LKSFASGGNYWLSPSTKAKLVLAVVVSFFIFQLFLFVKSFPAEYNLYLRFLERLQTNDPFWTSFWFASELIGEVGLALRFLGSCFALTFAYFLVAKRQTVLSLLRKAVLFEGAYYVFNLPFIVSLFARSNSSIVNVQAGLSYLLQLLLVSPAFFMLYSNMKKPNLSNAELFRWGAIGAIGFTFALWVKHFLLNVYALPISLEDPVLSTGFLNSALTMLVAGLILIMALFPVIRRKRLNHGLKLVAAGSLLIGVYFIIYVAISSVNQRYSSFVSLTELWAIAFIIPGIGLILEKD